jgi:transcriptional regulator with XRE-family HTH domain
VAPLARVGGNVSQVPRSTRLRCDPERLQAACERTGLSLNQIALRARIDRLTLVRLLEGRATYRRSVERLAHTLGVDPAELLAEPEPEEPKA